MSASRSFDPSTSSAAASAQLSNLPDTHRPRPAASARPPTRFLRTRRTFSISSYVLLTQIEQEFTYHRDITAIGGFDGTEFTLDIECDDTTIAVWQIQVVVMTFDPGSRLRCT